jgi:hypothetical protein
MISFHTKKLNRFSEDMLWQQLSGPCESLSLSKLRNVSTLVVCYCLESHGTMFILSFIKIRTVMDQKLIRLQTHEHCNTINIRFIIK